MPDWKVCIHWTAGPYAVTSADFEHYHYTVGPEGKVTGGKHAPKDNIPPLRNGHYAAHCGGGNSYCIGVAMRGMAGFKNLLSAGNYPIKAQQCEATWEHVARLCKDYHIPVTPDRTFTHYEYGKAHPKSDSWGKIDIIYLPYQPHLQASQVGDFIRDKVKWYLGRV